MLVPFVVRMDADGGIAEHCLRPRRRETDELAGSILDRILEGPEAAFDVLGVCLVVGDRRLQLRVPVDEAFAAVDVAVLEPVEERDADRPAATFVERKPRPRPVARAAELL